MSLLLATGLVSSQFVGQNLLPAKAGDQAPVVSVNTAANTAAGTAVSTTVDPQTQEKLDHDDLTIDDVKVEGNRLVPTEAFLVW